METMTTTMTYSESAKSVRITKARAFAELRAHGCAERADFLSDMADERCHCGTRLAAHVPDGCGSHDFTFDAGHVLEWLGY